MKSDSQEYIGFLRYSGPSVEGGYLDARKSAKALLAFDGSIRFFIEQQSKELAGVDFEIPVRIRKGSWEALIPQTIGEWIATGGGALVLGYLANAGKKMADNDFKDVGVADVFKTALRASQWFLKIGKHVGDASIKSFDRVLFKDDNRLIGIRNADGELLYVPRNFLELYAEAPANILKGMAELVEYERALSIGVYEGNEIVEETLTLTHRKIFVLSEDEDEELIFPELKHGDQIKIEGEITRGNENSNSIGIRYRGRILTGIPQSGSIVRWKERLFTKGVVHGSVSRLDDNGKIALKRPKIVIDDIRRVPSDEPSLFDEEDT